MGSTLEAPRGSDGAKLDGAFGVTPVAGGCWPPGNPRFNEYSLEGLMLKLKLQYFGHLMQRTDSLEKTLMLGKIEGRKRRGRQRISYLECITNSMDMSLSTLRDGRGSALPRLGAELELLLPSIFPSIRIFFKESALHIRCPKYWSFSFSISPSNEYSGLISFSIDWLDLFVIQVTLKSVIQHHSSKNINSLVLHFLYSPTLTSVHDHWKNHSLD